MTRGRRAIFRAGKSACRNLELEHACYGATAGVRLAASMIAGGALAKGGIDDELIVAWLGLFGMGRFPLARV